LYPHPALVPVMPWLGSHVPDAVEDIHVMRSHRALVTLSWTASPTAARYAVYRYATDRLPADPTIAGTPDAMLDVTGETRFGDSTALPGSSYMYVITAIGRNGEESVARAVFVD
jgi:fibronectin type 3 domain-containing protein